MSEHDPRSPRVAVARERYAFGKKPSPRKVGPEPKIIDDSESWSFKGPDKDRY